MEVRKNLFVVSLFVRQFPVAVVVVVVIIILVVVVVVRWSVCFLVCLLVSLFLCSFVRSPIIIVFRFLSFQYCR